MTLDDDRLTKLMQPGPIDITGGQSVEDKGIGDLLAKMVQQQNVTTTAAAAPDPDAIVANALANALNPPAPPPPTQSEPSRFAQAAAEGLNRTAQEDAIMNRATAATRVNQQFGGAPPIGDTFRKLLPKGEQLTAFPSGGYAVNRSGADQDAIVNARRAAFAGRTDFAAQESRRRMAGDFSSGLGPPLRYGSQGIRDVGGNVNIPPVPQTGSNRINYARLLNSSGYGTGRRRKY